MLFQLQTPSKHFHSSQKFLLTDNTSTVAALNKMGTTKILDKAHVNQGYLNFFLQKNSIVEVPSGSKYTSGITATQIQGIYNEEPQIIKEIENEDCVEVKYRDSQYVTESFVSFTDLFASRLKKTLSELMSYRPDPECVVAQRRIENPVKYLRRSIRRR